MSRSYSEIRACYKELDDVLRNQLPISADEIRDRIAARVMHLPAADGYPEQTLQEDLTNMVNGTATSVIIYDNNGKDCYKYTNPNFSFDETLTDKDFNLLDQAITDLESYSRTDIFKEDFDALVKIRERYEASQPGSKPTFVQFDPPKITEGKSHFEQLYRSIKEQMYVVVSYLKFDQTVHEYRLAGHLMKEFENRWYFVGFDPDLGDMRRLPLDRIRAIKTGVNGGNLDQFTRQPNFDPALYFQHTVGVYILGNPVKITIKVRDDYTAWLTTAWIHPTQQVVSSEAGNFLIQIEVFNTIEIWMELAKHGNKIEVIDPQEVKESLLAHTTG